MRDERGSAVAEFVMVTALLTMLALAVIQLAIALHIRNTITDAASEGARFGALADNTLADGEKRTMQLIAAAIGPDYANDVHSSVGRYLGHPAITITVDAPLPVVGIMGGTGGLEVSGHAALEVLE